ncbi:DUF805 domain-containing protein [Sphingomonas sp. HITSZ_GF]|uniref:DUF805 domain-containing protein n=1 Tax=Sphingomonas sp. HITSZ_GF TaxID=3037247 RepID=UPI00240E22E7|nr:DUF805 domain-containing protein [Sphingomonas sp. HITSZ_GF]MDG2534322.1 DUF805 domain-containing protein [Sphingomonas sp. HITSZ_GF]
MSQGYRSRSGWGLIFNPLRMALVFTGRATRSDVLGWWLLGGVLFGLLAAITHMFAEAIWLEAIPNLIIGLATIALLVRRLHDIGHSGWWMALLLGVLIASVTGIHYYADAHPDAGVTANFLSVHLHGDVHWTPTLAALVALDLLGLLCTFALMLIPGAIGTNRYGPDPRMGREVSEPA